MMAGRPFIVIPDLEALAERYRLGESVAEICEGTDLPPHTLRRRFIDLGIMRNKTEGPKMAFARGRMDHRKTRVGVPQSEEGKRKQSETMRAKMLGKGTRITSQGYVEFTRQGPLVNKLEHIVIMERRLGRALRSDECVHHIDRDTLNNNENNLALMTRAAHSRLHRFEDQLEGKERPRDRNGRFVGDK